MKLIEALADAKNYIVIDNDGIVAINGNFGSKSLEQYQDREVLKIRTLPGQYQDYTQIRI